MERLGDIRFAIFGFNDIETGNKLRNFFYRHTGRDIDFNGIKQYPNGLRLLCFSIPLGTVYPISIVEAINHSSKIYKEFHESVDVFISWYENEYLTYIKENNH